MAYSLILWRHCLNWSFLLSNDHSLCQIDMNPYKKRMLSLQFTIHSWGQWCLESECSRSLNDIYPLLSWCRIVLLHRNQQMCSEFLYSMTLKSMLLLNLNLLLCSQKLTYQDSDYTSNIIFHIYKRSKGSEYKYLFQQLLHRDIFTIIIIECVHFQVNEKGDKCFSPWRHLYSLHRTFNLLPLTSCSPIFCHVHFGHCLCFPWEGPCFSPLKW